ncbi:MAG: type II toxin-antitoxin system VapC family toxin [Thermodesulfobacteriota bacterium]|nr:type II toxin-antitoxin system VapC family toxin [Thermodesulfobacteriota bacterium]
MLLDTHIFLWWLFDDPRLPAGIKRNIRNVDNAIYISAASVWEIATKFRIGKLPEAVSVARNVPAWIEKAGFIPMAVTPEHAQLAGSWDVSHRDPFDRMLASQAKLEKIPLASIDRSLGCFPIVIKNR